MVLRRRAALLIIGLELLTVSSASSSHSFDFEYAINLGWFTGASGGGNPTHPFSRRAGSTPSSSTGPSSGSGGSGYYFYAETSSPRQPGDVFTLSYDGSVCAMAGAVVDSVSFHYHMYGATMGTLRVDAAGSEAWRASGNKGNAWHTAALAVNAASFHFEYVRGSSWSGDAALDEVTVNCSSPLPALPPSPPMPPWVEP